jgi:hypothetical protein
MGGSHSVRRQVRALSRRLDDEKASRDVEYMNLEVRVAIMEKKLENFAKDLYYERSWPSIKRSPKHTRTNYAELDND